MIRTRDLTKLFKVKRGNPVRAVDGVSIDVEEGELVAVLGPNGAGKTTTLRMLTTLLMPTSGTALVAGHDVRRHPAMVRRHLGHIGQGSGAGEYQLVRDELVTQGYAYRLSRREAKRRADELLDTLQLADLGKRAVSTLSGGQRRRLDIALGLVHHPPLLFLDEPSTGLDPHNRANLWDHVMAVRERYGTTMLLTTHYLEEADGMAERVMIIDGGRIIADDPSEKLKADLAGDRIVLHLAGPDDAARAAELGDRIAQIHEVELDGPVLSVRAPGGHELVPTWLRELDRAGVAVASAEVTRPTLDDVFLTLTGRSLREEGHGSEVAADGEEAGATGGVAA